MPLCADKAVVLRRLDYSESSQILIFFTRNHGKIRLIARGIKRGTRARFAAGVDLLELGEVVWSARPDRQRTLSILTEWKQTCAFSGLRDELQRLYAGQYAAEVTSELTVEEDPHPGLFEALVNFLAAADKSNPSVLIPLCAYQRTLLIEVGLMPQTDVCQECRRGVEPQADVPLYFSSRQGGLICRDCESAQVEKRRIRWDLVRALQAGCPTESLAASWFDLLNYHLTETLHRPPRLAEYVLSATRRRSV